MRALRWMALITLVFGGLLGLAAAAEAAPVPVSAGVVERTNDGPGVRKAQWYFVRRHYYRPRYYRRYYRPRYYYRPRFYRRYYHRPRFYRRRYFY